MDEEFKRVAGDDGEEGDWGLFGSIQRVVLTTLAALQSRLELFAVESKELKVRAFSLAALGIALVFFGLMTIFSLMATIVFLLWTQGLLVLIGFSIFFVVVAVGSFVVASRQLNKIPFGDSVDQLRKDRDLLSKERL